MCLIRCNRLVRLKLQKLKGMGEKGEDLCGDKLKHVDTRHGSTLNGDAETTSKSSINIGAIVGVVGS